MDSPTTSDTSPAIDDRSRRNQLISLFVAGALLLLVGLYFLKLGTYPLIDPDEPIYGEVAKEMAHGDWLTPHLNGAAWFDKPPMFYWLSSACVRFLGVTEFACRLPSALLGIGLVGLVYALAACDFGRRVAQLSAVIMATCLLQIALARTAITDMTLAFFLTLALLCYRHWLARDLQGNKQQALNWALGCGAATGFAMLTKGPVAPVLLGLTFLIHLWWTKNLVRLRGFAASGAILMALLVGLPWYVAMYVIHKQDFVQGFLVANNLTRFAKAEHSHGNKWYANFYNVPVLFAFFFPWSVFLPQAIARAWRSARTQGEVARSDANDGIRLALTWFAVVFIFFTLSRTQLITYTFPLYPAAAILVGVLWNSIKTDDAKNAVGIARGLRWALGVNATLALLAVFAAVTHSSALGMPKIVSIGAGGIFLLACALAWRSLSRDWGKPGNSVQSQSAVSSFNGGAYALGGGMTCLLFWLLLSLPLGLAEGKSTREIVRTLADQKADVVACDVNIPSFVFYADARLRKRYVETSSKREAIVALSRAQPVFVICQRRSEKRILAPNVIEWMRSGTKVVLGNKAAAAGQSGRDFRAADGTIAP